MNRNTRHYYNPRETQPNRTRKVCVQAQDGYFYQDPVCFGTDWYLQFYEGGYPNLVLFGPKCPARTHQRALEVIEEMKIKAGIMGMEPPTQSRYFPPKFRSLRRAAIVHLWVQSAIPVPQIGPKLALKDVTGVIFQWTSSQSESSSPTLSNDVSLEKSSPELKLSD